MCSTTWSETAWSSSAMSHAVWRASSCASTQQLSLRLGGFRCFLDGHGLDSTPADPNLRCDSAAPSKGSYTADRQTESVKAQPYQRRPTFHLTEIVGLTYLRKSQHQIGTRILQNACGGEKPRTRAEGVRYNAANYVLHRHTAPAQCPRRQDPFRQQSGERHHNLVAQGRNRQSPASRDIAQDEPHQGAGVEPEEYRHTVF